MNDMACHGRTSDISRQVKKIFSLKSPKKGALCLSEQVIVEKKLTFYA